MNIFWGYVFQLHWQWQTGRLQLPDTPPGRIAAESPWGYANYALSIIPLIAAMQVGMAPQKEILTTGSELEHASGGGRAGAFKIPARFESALGQWRELFSLVSQLPKCGDIEPVRFKLWKAHFSSLSAVEPFTHKLSATYTP